MRRTLRGPGLFSRFFLLFASFDLRSVYARDNLIRVTVPFSLEHLFFTLVPEEELGWRWWSRPSGCCGG